MIHFEFAGKAVELAELFDLIDGPKFVSCRGSDVSIQPLTDPRHADRLREVLGRADRVHCVSAEVRRRAGRWGLVQERAFVNHPAIDPAYFRPSAPSQRGGEICTVLSVGRIHWVKGYEYALQAIRHLIDRGRRVRYVIAGGGSACDAVRFALWELGVEGVVELVGPKSRERVRELMNDADIFLLPSVSEGLSNVALEAMAMELPIVTTDAGGMVEAVTDGIEGYVVPTRDPAAIADRLGLLLGDAARRLQLGQAGRRRILADFQLERQVQVFLDEYLAVSGRLAPLPRPFEPAAGPPS